VGAGDATSDSGQGARVLLMSDSATWVAVGLAIGAAASLLSSRPSLSCWSSCAGGGAHTRRSSSSSGTRSSGLGPFERLHLSAGIAQLRQDDDATSFFERADEALYQAKEAGKGQFMAADEVG
jgi:GGDEF domain-containing protein